MYNEVCIKDKNYIEKTNKFLSDYSIDKAVPEGYLKVVFSYSRIFCDVERFKDDSKEEMSSKGMGVIYTHDCDEVIALPNRKYKKTVIKSYYDKHHNKLDKTVSKVLNKNGKCILIDLHSYSDEMVFKLFGKKDNPDICLGVDTVYTSRQLIKFTTDFFSHKGYSVEINNPYGGTIIPNKFFHKKDGRLESIMIEINKRIYLENEINLNKLKEVLKEYCSLLEQIYL